MATISVGRRVSYAFRCFFALLWRGVIPADILGAVGGAVAVPPGAGAGAAPPRTAHAAQAAPSRPADDPGDRAVQLLALLQRDGRLVDFLLEDLTPYTDAQVSAAVRDVHANCRRAIDRYLSLEPILGDE